MESEHQTENLSTLLPALPNGWIERIFARLGAAYGNKFREMWKDQEMADVMQLWAQELARYSGAELQRGLSSLRREHPAWPPTLYEFGELCKPQAQPAHKALPWPKIEAGTLDPRIRELKETLTAPRLHPRAWAAKLLQRHVDGDKTVDPYALKMARDAERIAAGGQVLA